MARQFNGTSQYLQSTGPLTGLSGAPRIAVGFWLWGTFAPDDASILELSDNPNVNDGSIMVLGNESGTGKLAFNCRNVNGPTSLGLTTTPSDSTWHHYLVNFDFSQPAASEVQVFLDGVEAPLTTVLGPSENTGTFGSYVLNVMARNGSALFSDGRLADLAIWVPTTRLGAAEAVALTGGARAGTVRAGELGYYWPLTGTSSPEPASVGSIALTVAGATLVADPVGLGGSGPQFVLSRRVTLG